VTAINSTPDNGQDEADLGVSTLQGSSSQRGGLQIFMAPELDRPPTPNEVTDADANGALDSWDYSKMLDDDHNEDDVRSAVEAMNRSLAPGNIVTYLFGDGDTSGMSLKYIWFGPHLPLYRHSHPLGGDCLYYVLAGQAILGNRVLSAGDGFFVPNGMPYKYRAGAEGVEFLEFRAGGGIEGAPALRVHETSIEPILRVTETATKLHSEWQDPPRRISDIAHIRTRP
jgi:hypothetical protein